MDTSDKVVLTLLIAALLGLIGGAVKVATCSSSSSIPDEVRHSDISQLEFNHVYQTPSGGCYKALESSVSGLLYWDKVPCKQQQTITVNGETYELVQ